jgi:HEAT repeat protein
MAYKIPLNLYLKRSASLLAASCILCSTHSFAKSSSEGGGGGEKKKRQGSFSAEELDDMKQSQLLYYLSNQNYQSSEYAVYYFEQKGEPGVTPLLKHLKKNEDEDKVVSAVLYTFGRIGPEAARAVPVIMKYLEHENTDIRKTAISSLGKIGKASEPAVPKIAEYLSDENEWTRTLALRSLKEIGTPAAKSIARQYENTLKLEEERKKAKLMGEAPKEDKKTEKDKEEK